MAGGRRPHFDVCVKTKDGVVPERKGKIGAAWVQDNGSINIRLNTCVVLAESDNLIINLFPIKAEIGKPATDPYGTEQINAPAATLCLPPHSPREKPPF